MVELVMVKPTSFKTKRRNVIELWFCKTAQNRFEERGFLDDRSAYFVGGGWYGSGITRESQEF